MKFTFDEASAKAAGGESTGNKVLDTGVYNVTIVTASKTVASTGTEGIDWSLQVEGQKYPNMVYGMWIQKANGDKIFNMDIVQGLMGLIGASTLTEYSKEIQIKNGTKKVMAYKELDGVTCQVAIQKILDIYNGEVSEKNEIKVFFGEDGKTYAEKAGGRDSKQIKYYSESLKDKETDKYKAYLLDTEDEAEVEDTDTKSLL